MALNTSNANAAGSGGNSNNNGNDNSGAIGSGGGGGGGSTTPNVASPGSKPSDGLMVRIDENSNEDLQALFDSVLKPSESRRPLQVPLRMRKLPDSFFKPPSSDSKSPSVSVSHTRENSADSAFGSGTNTICSTNGGSNNGIAGVNIVGVNAINRLQISHSRAHSSPASLQQTYAGLKTQNANPVVGPAVAVATSPNANNNNSNSNNTTNSNTNNNTSSSNAVNLVGLAQQPPNPRSTQEPAPVEFNQPPNHARHRSFDRVSSIQLREELGDLPPGWEMTRTSEGQVYYIE